MAGKRSTISKIELHLTVLLKAPLEEIFGLKMHKNFLIGPSNNNHFGNMAHAKLFPLFGRYGPEKPTAFLNYKLLNITNEQSEQPKRGNPLN